MEKSLQLVKRYYDAFNAKDFATMLACLDENVEHELNQGESQAGLAKFRNFMDHMNECYDEHLDELVLFGGGEGRVAAEFFVRGQYLSTDGALPPAHGQKYRIRAGAFLEVKNDKICRVTTYYNLPEWIAAVKS
jgi:steroid delta-isomerase-like uncharacterized protein